MTGDITLASGSKSRQALLAAAGVEAAIVPPHVDEEAAKAAMRQEGLAVRDQAMALAELKAQKVSSSRGGFVIGCDQMLSLNDIPFDKPESLERARDHLHRLSGKTHHLETAIVVFENGVPVWRHLSRPKLSMRPLSEGFIDTYVDRVGEPLLSTVGAYQLEGLGVQLFSAIEGDYFSILGLPLLPLLDFLRVRGVLAS